LQRLTLAYSERLNLLEGLNKCISELTSQPSSDDNKNDNWIIYVSSSSDLSSFTHQNEYVKLVDLIRESKVNIVFVTLGINDESKLSAFKKVFSVSDKVR
jgi:hypothetical protein